MNRFDQLYEKLINEGSGNFYVEDNGVFYKLHWSGDILTVEFTDSSKRLTIQVTNWTKTSSLKDEIHIIDHRNKFEEPEKGQLWQHGFQIKYDNPNDLPKDVQKEYKKIQKVMQKEISGEYEHLTYSQVAGKLKGNRLSISGGTLPGISHKVMK